MFSKRGFLLIFVFLFLFSLTFSSAQIQTLPQPVKTGDCVTLPQSYANITYSNISTIQTPLGLQTLNALQTNLGSGYFNYTYCNTTANGEYIVNGIADKDGVPTTWVFSFVVNPLGKLFTTSQAMLYILVFFVALILFVLCIIGAGSINSENKRDQMTGYIIAIENMKYVKIVLWFISYLLVLLMTYFGWMVSYGYLDMNFLGNLFQFAFYVLAIGTVPLLVVGLYIVIANAIRDSQIKEEISRGFKIK